MPSAPFKLEPRPRQRYTPYRKPHEQTYLDALNSCLAKSKSKLNWIEDFRRTEGNKATHTATPVLTCIVYEQPEEKVQMHLRRTASTRTDAIEAAKSAVRSRLDGKTLIEFYARVEDDGQENLHRRYRVVDINYIYRLDDYAVTECQAEGGSKSEARQKAAQMLLERTNYCMFIQDSNGPPRR